jgi:hypothetical protein
MLEKPLEDNSALFIVSVIFLLPDEVLYSATETRDLFLWAGLTCNNFWTTGLGRRGGSPTRITGALAYSWPKIFKYSASIFFLAYSRHHGLPPSSSLISCFKCLPVVCCSFLVLSRSQSQLDRTPSGLQDTVTRSALVFQLSTPFFVAVLVVSKGTILQLCPCDSFPLSCTHASLPPVAHCSNDSLVQWEPNVHGYHLSSPLISLWSKHWAWSKSTCSYCIDFMNGIAIWN